MVFVEHLVGSHMGTLNIRCRTIIGTKKGPNFLTNITLASTYFKCSTASIAQLPPERPQVLMTYTVNIRLIRGPLTADIGVPRVV